MRPACGRRAAVRFFKIFSTGWYGVNEIEFSLKQRKSQSDVREIDALIVNGADVAEISL